MRPAPVPGIALQPFSFKDHWWNRTRCWLRGRHRTEWHAAGYTWCTCCGGRWL